MGLSEYLLVALLADGQKGQIRSVQEAPCLRSNLVGSSEPTWLVCRSKPPKGG